MPIEFPCPECQQTVRTPDVSAGKKGQCPTCGAIVRIPAASSQAASHAPAAKPAALPTATDLGPIEFACPSCQGLVRTPRAAAGKRGKCPTCAAIVTIPAAGEPHQSAPIQSVPIAELARKPAPASTAAASAGADGPLEFPCPTCQGVVRTPQSAAGKKGKCPHCAAIVQIPTTSSPSTLSPAPTSKPKPAAQSQPTSSPAKPKPPAQAKPQPKVTEEIGLAPLDDLAPLPEPTPEPKPAPRPVTRPEPKPISHPAPTAPLSAPLPPLTPLGLAAPVTDPVANNGLMPLDGGLTPLDGLSDLSALNSSVLGAPALSGGLPPASSFTPGGGYGLPPASPYAPPPARQHGGSSSNIALVLPAVFQLIFTGLQTLFLAMATLFDLYLLILLFTVTQTTGQQLNDRGETAVGIIAIRTVWAVVALIAQGYVLRGAVLQMQQRDHDACVQAAWTSVVPCLMPCSFPWGIWSLIVLYQDSVRRSFRR